MGPAPRTRPPGPQPKRRNALSSFSELGVISAITDALDEVGITTAFPIQEQTLPIALTGTDVIGQARTGTGKTLAFGIPLIQRLVAPLDADWPDLAAPGKPQALVIVPTRELCVQVTGDLELAGRKRGVRVLSIYGGRAYEPQVAALNTGVEIVVGTPGRLLDLRKQRFLDLTHVKGLVLDEADEMLDLGFLPDVERLISDTPASRQTMLFSATMPGPVMSLARRYLSSPTHIRAESAGEDMTVPAIDQYVFRTHQMDKVETLSRILQAEGRQLVMVFAPTRRLCQSVADDLNERGFAAAAVHGDLGQGAREQALRAFRNGKVDVLVATDVAARGIDIDDVTHVVNYECPDDEKTYVHRIGRTGRAGRKGVSVTFVDWADMTRWTLINKALNLGLAEPAEPYSTSPHRYEALNIPAGTKGRLPRASQTRAGLDAEHVEDLGETGRNRSKPTSKVPASRKESDTPRTERPKRNRSRTRTRSGEPVSGEAPASGGVAVVEAPKAGDTGEAGAPRARRRRRSRGGGGAKAAEAGSAE
ncbi:MAG: DEAD/DEAH box helicase [Sporichthyaceae bacterium]